MERVEGEGGAFTSDCVQGLTTLTVLVVVVDFRCFFLFHLMFCFFFFSFCIRQNRVFVRGGV